MNSEFRFNKDFDEHTAYIMKVFAEKPSVVWKYFTQAEFLDQWWAPKPWKCETQRLEFSEGGKWFYAMVGPEGEKEFVVSFFNSITEGRSLEWKDDFADENGNPSESGLSATWLLGFTGVEEGTKLTMNLHFSSEESMRKIFEMGFEEGITATLGQLEKILEAD